MKKVLSMAALAVSVALGGSTAFAASHSESEINITVVSHGQANDAFWSVVKNGVEAAGKDMGVNVDYRSPETFNMVAMSSLIDAAVNQEPDGLVVSIPDGDALATAIQKAVAAGIPVVSTIVNAANENAMGRKALQKILSDSLFLLTKSVVDLKNYYLKSHLHF